MLQSIISYDTLRQFRHINDYEKKEVLFQNVESCRPDVSILVFQEQL
jgi:hypothetical protein